MRSNSLFFVVATASALLLSPAAAQVFPSVPEGIPYLRAAVTNAAGFNDTAVTDALVTRLKGNSLSSFAGVLSSANVIVYDVWTEGNQHSFSVGVGPIAGLTNVATYNAMNTLKTAITSNIVFPATTYTHINSTVVENPCLSSGCVKVRFTTFGKVYVNKVAAPVTVSLSASPQIGTTVRIHIQPVHASITYSVSYVDISWPALTAAFTMTAGGVVTSSGLILTGFSGSTDPTPSRYVRDAAGAADVLQVLGLESIVVTPVPPTARLYDGQPSGTFALQAPTHKDTSINVIVQVVVNPPGSNLTVTPPNVTITTPGADATFYVSGAVGTFTISYYINPPWMVGATVLGKNNDEFNQITYSSAITIRPLLNVTIANVPTAYVVNPVPYTGLDANPTAYGGAYSVDVPVHIQQDPITSMQVEFLPTTDVEASPPSIMFFAGGLGTYTFRFRALSTGLKTLYFRVAGTDAGDYQVISPPRKWLVRGKNVKCVSYNTQNPCITTPGCQWNVQRNWCTNNSLPIHVSAIPLLYDGEQSDFVNFSLPTPVRSSLTVTFRAAARLSFSPASITLMAGMANATFRITGNLLPGDENLLQENFVLILSGDNANEYDQQLAYAVIRQKIICIAEAPLTGFFVRTWSDPFTINCDAAPEDDVTFTPHTTTPGITFEASGLYAGQPKNVVWFHPGDTARQFIANSSSDATGTATLTVTISGTNAPRYAPVTATTFRVLPPGRFNLPPNFHLTQFGTSGVLHLDVDVPPPTPLYVNMTAQLNDTASAEINITISPNYIVFNNSMRGSFNVSSNGTGRYYIDFTFTGEHLRNYLVTRNRVRFDVLDPVDGKAFEARLEPGYLSNRKQCRVSTGMSSVRFKGQDPVRRVEDLCGIHPPFVFPNETYACEDHDSRQSCQRVLAKRGHACVWHQNRCQFLQQVQGNVLSFGYGSDFTVFLTNAGEVWTIGGNRYGQLGHENNAGLGLVPLPESIATIAVGAQHVMALSYMGKVYTWGANQRGQLGLSTRTQHKVDWGEVPFPRGENISCISAGVLHNVAMSLSGRLYTWGDNKYGQLGHEGTFRRYSNAPVSVSREHFDGDAVVAVQCGEYHTMVATDNNAYTFGSNTMGQLGRVGFDEWRPQPPVLWQRNKFNTAPTWASYVLGRDC